MKIKNKIYSEIKSDEDGVISSWFFNLDLYYKVIKARSRKIQNDDKIVKHSLTGKKIKRNGKEYIVENVYKFWWLGYYLHALLRREGTQSHGGMDFENISCQDEITLKTIKNNKYEILTN